MKKSYLKKVVVGLLALTLAGCATIFSGTTQTINVQVVDENTNKVIPNARCNITDGKGRVYAVSSNPATITVTKGQGALDTRCKAAGYRQKQVGVGESFNAWTVANVLFWPGLLVDAATGAVQKYPSHITVLMERTSHRR
jgi:hypothetical protein